jgi:outer membrane protein assembly factor BamA
MVAVLLDREDTVSPPSLFGGGAMYTSSGSWAYGLLTKLYLKQDRFRILGAIGDGRLNYDFYGSGHDNGEDGLYIPITQKSFAFLVEPTVRVFRRWYVGPRYRMLSSTVALDPDKLKDEPPTSPDLGVELPDRDRKVQSAALGLRLERDSRDSQIYPRKGSLFDTKLDFYRSAFGSQRDYEGVEISFQGYVGFKKKNVIAYRGAVCAATGDVPFYNLCLFGQSKDIRGYSVGRYQDRRMLVGQVEYRRELFWRIGAVGFFGAGEVAKEFSKFNARSILPGGGLGLRITLAKQNHINLRIDYAWGKDSTAFYVGVVEAF